MKDQHKLITGYRDVDCDDIDIVNELKSKYNELFAVIDSMEGVDPRNVAIAKTKLQESAMWAIKSVMKPETPC